MTSIGRSINRDLPHTTALLYRPGRQFAPTGDRKEWSPECKEAEMRRLINLTITALVVFAAVSGSAAALPVDYVSPDARDSARQVSSPQIDLRSPDARDTSTVETYTPGHVTQAS